MQSTTIMSELEREIGSLSLEQKSDCHLSTEQKQKEGSAELELRDFRELANLNLVIATLIAAIAFQPAIQMPGGYDEKGFAVHDNKRNFVTFLFLDSLAFWFSSFSILIYFIGTVSRRVSSKMITMMVLLSELALVALGHSYTYALKTVLPTTPYLSTFWFIVSAFITLCYVFCGWHLLILRH